MDETIMRLKERAKADGFSILGETALPDSRATVVYACKSRWADTLVAESPSLFGLLPCAVVVYEKAGLVMVGAGSPSVLGGVSDSAAVQELASTAELGIRKLIDEAAGAGELKPKGVKLYSTKSCPYCRMEKSWLDSKKIKYDLVYVDEDQGEAERLVARTGQMGVPVTELLYEDQDSEFVFGFDQARLAAMLA
jgi:Glutaredoxin and related proteins